eukprot:CAMPEP_0118930722 /NCGR_PEP_ID=MMETSP1169-20130426/7314_1 /TAXON_ID=36882 /ORGANISM="Pyramimonas obovata, Strain CCMP722" /LENGTH=96 /DNA_ID=CAMNT_0006873121 /DNA_START=115 /DNA_END=402 /DNA_ORIENTATION=+
MAAGGSQPHPKPALRVWGAHIPPNPAARELCAWMERTPPLLRTEQGERPYRSRLLAPHGALGYSPERDSDRASGGFCSYLVLRWLRSGGHSWALGA